MKSFHVLFIVSFLFIACATPTQTSEVLSVPTNQVVASANVVPTEARSTPTAKPSTENLNPTVTPTSCIELSDSIFINEDVRVFFHGEVSTVDCALIQRYVRQTVEMFESLDIPTGMFEVHVSEDPKILAEKEFEIGRASGCNPDSVKNIENIWIDHGPSGKGTYGGVFLLSGEWAARDKADAIVHETGQHVIYSILGSCQKRWKLADWYANGLVEYWVDLFTHEFGFSYRTVYLNDCTSSLGHLQAGVGNDCIYNQTPLIFPFLAEQYGAKDVDALRLLSCMAEDKSFDKCFEEAYGVSVKQFIKEFDVWFMTTYLVTATPTTTPDSGD